LRWVTVRGYTVLVCNHPLRPTQPPTLNKMGNEYRSRSSGRNGITVGLTLHRPRARLRGISTQEREMDTRTHEGMRYGILYLSGTMTLHSRERSRRPERRRDDDAVGISIERLSTARGRERAVGDRLRRSTATTGRTVAHTSRTCPRAAQGADTAAAQRRLCDGFLGANDV